jgi:hypothetical protein
MTMRKFVVYYKSHRFGDTFVHVFAVQAGDAVQHVEQNGIDYDNGPVFADRVVGVQEVSNV